MYIHSAMQTNLYLVLQRPFLPTCPVLIHVSLLRLRVTLKNIKSVLIWHEGMSIVSENRYPIVYLGRLDIHPLMMKGVEMTRSM